MAIQKHGSIWDKRLRDALADLIRHIRGISDAVIIVRPFYRRKKNAQIPTRPQRIECILDPRANGFDHCLTAFTSNLSWYHPGTITKKDLRRLAFVFNRFLNLLEPLNRIPEIDELCNTVQSLLSYLTSEQETPSAREHVERVENDRKTILRLLGVITRSFHDVTRECEKHQKELAQSAKEKAAKTDAKNTEKSAPKAPATAPGSNAEDITKTIRQATKEITSAVTDTGKKTVAAVKDLGNSVAEAKKETVAAVRKAKRDSHDDAITLMEIGDPEHLHHPVPKDRKRKNGRSKLKTEFVQAGIDEIRSNPLDKPTTCCRRVHNRWMKNRPADFARTYPNFKTFRTIVVREAQKQKLIPLNKRQQ